MKIPLAIVHRLAGCAESSVAKAVAADELSRFKAGGRWQVHSSDLALWMLRLRRVPSYVRPQSEVIFQENFRAELEADAQRILAEELIRKTRHLGRKAPSMFSVQKSESAAA